MSTLFPSPRPRPQIRRPDAARRAELDAAKAEQDLKIAELKAAGAASRAAHLAELVSDGEQAERDLPGLEAAVVAAKAARRAGVPNWQDLQDAQRAVESALAAIKQGRITREWLRAQASVAS